MDSSRIGTAPSANARRAALGLRESRSAPVRHAPDRSVGCEQDRHDDLDTAHGVFFGAFLGAMAWSGIAVVWQLMRLWID